jgi:hypothetical protein
VFIDRGMSMSEFHVNVVVGKRVRVAGRARPEGHVGESCIGCHERLWVKAPFDPDTVPLCIDCAIVEVKLVDPGDNKKDQAFKAATVKALEAVRKEMLGWG